MKGDSSPPEREREREQSQLKCFTCQKEVTDGAINFCTICHSYGNKKRYCLNCFGGYDSNGEKAANDKSSLQDKLEEHKIECKQSEQTKKNLQAGWWNCRICGENLWESGNEGGLIDCSCPTKGHPNIKWCNGKHSNEEINKLMDGIHNELEQNPSQKEKTLGEILKSETPQETIHYTCPHQAKMTEPNCSICLGEVEKELRKYQEEQARKEEAKKKAEEESKRTGLAPYSESENIIGNSVSNVHIITNSTCPKCGTTLKYLSGSYYQHQGIKTNMQQKIETKHCLPEQIASYQKKLKVGSSKIKEILDSQEKAEMEKVEQIQVQTKQTKLQKTQNFILGGILVSLLVLTGIGVYWILKKSKNDKESK